MARKKIEMKTRPRLKASTFADDIIERKKGNFPTAREGSGRAGAKSISTALDEPSARPLAKRGSREVTRLGRPSMDVDGRQKRLPGFKDVTGPAERVSKPSLPVPKAEVPSLSRASKVGMGARALTGLGALAYSPDVGEGSDKPRNYPGEGLSQVGPTKPAAKPVAKSTGAPAPKMSAATTTASKPAASKPVAKPVASKPVAKPVASKPTPKPAATRASLKPVPRVAKPSRADTGRDDFMADLRASARKMRDTSSEMASSTGRMKEKMGEFASSFKRGGAIKSRGDGIAQRGKTKGRFR
jgi:hypothetical protein